MKPTDHEPFDFSRTLADLQPQLRYFLLALTGSVSKTDELVQQTNAIALEKRSRFVPHPDSVDSSMKAWLFEIARRLTRALGRHESREKVAQPFAEEPTDWRGFDDDGFQRDREFLQKCLKQLPESSRRLVVARHVHQQSLGELARTETRSANALAQKLFRIRRALAECIERARLANEMASLPKSDSHEPC